MGLALGDTSGSDPAAWTDWIWPSLGPETAILALALAAAKSPVMVARVREASRTLPAVLALSAAVTFGEFNNDLGGADRAELIVEHGRTHVASSSEVASTSERFDGDMVTWSRAVDEIRRGLSGELVAVLEWDALDDVSEELVSVWLPPIALDGSSEPEGHREARDA